MSALNKRGYRIENGLLFGHFNVLRFSLYFVVQIYGIYEKLIFFALKKFK
jgi:hypothetical protein